ncbi:hypothetical protein DL93DRAFT_2166139 [Clavulina sp. PMI_390]|nr:hypothetical protein DL93DRAFT_2166139 [Clavulina sp. PMI_390]
MEESGAPETLRAALNLIKSFSTSILPSERDFLASDHSTRDGVRRAFSQHRVPLESIYTELANMLNQIDSHLKQLESKLCSIAMLPPELLRNIFIQTVGHRENYGQVIRLAHVSNSWRDVVSGISELFTLIPWNRWSTSVPLIRQWRQWAKDRPQSIRLAWSQGLCDSYINRPDIPAPLLDELEACLPSCSNLYISSTASVIELFDFLGLCHKTGLERPNRIFHNLSRMGIHDTSFVTEQLTVDASCLPALSELGAYNVGVLLKGSSGARNSVFLSRLGPNSMWKGWGSSITPLLHLETLSLSNISCDLGAGAAPPTLLSKLNTIEFVGSVLDIEKISSALSAPLVTVLSFRNFLGPMNDKIWKALDEAFPKVTTINVVTTRHYTLDNLLEGLSPRGNAAARKRPFAHLHEIILMGESSPALLNALRDAVVDRQHAQWQPITHVTLPPREKTELLDVNEPVLRSIKRKVPNLRIPALTSLHDIFCIPLSSLMWY